MAALFLPSLLKAEGFAGLNFVSFNSGSAIDIESYGEKAPTTVLYPEIAETNSGWGEKTTYVYWGYIYLDGSTYNFAASIDDATYLKIDDKVILNDSVWDTVDTGSITCKKGWYKFELRFYNGSGGAGYVAKDGWGGSSYGFGYNTGAYTGKDGSGYKVPKDDGSGNLFRTRLSIDVAAEEKVVDGLLESVDVKFEELQSSVHVYAVWGGADFGEDASAWPNKTKIAQLEKGSISAAWTPVEYWGSADARFVRFYLDENGFLSWSNPIAWREYAVPEIANFTLDAVSTDSIQVKGNMLSFVGASCSLNVHIREENELNETTLVGLSGSTLTKFGDFSVALPTGKISNTYTIEKAHKYFIRVTANANGQTYSTAVSSVYVPDGDEINVVSAAANSGTFTVKANMQNLASQKDVNVVLYFGESPDALYQVGDALAISGSDEFTLSALYDWYGATYYWQLRAVCLNEGSGNYFEVRTPITEITTPDQTEYKWKNGVKSGRWDDPNNWENDRNGKCFGYPASKSATAKFRENYEAEVLLPVEVKAALLDIMNGVNIILTPAPEVEGRVQFDVGRIENRKQGSITLTDVNLISEEAMYLGENRVMCLKDSYFQCYDLFIEGGAIDCDNSTVYHKGSSGFRGNYNKTERPYIARFNGGAVVDTDRRFVIDGNSHGVFTNGFRREGGSIVVGSGYAGSATLEITDKATIITKSELSCITTAENPTTAGTIKLHDVTAYNTYSREADWLIAGAKGNGTIDISASYVSNSCGKALIAKESTSTGCLILSNNTTLAINKIYGGEGDSTFYADGAVVVPKLLGKNTTIGDFVSNIDVACIGEGGLTIDTDYPTDISQDFTNISGKEGVLILAGAGAKNVTGANSSHAITKLLEGDCALPLVYNSKVEVTGGAVNLQDNVASTYEFEQLVLGDTQGVAGVIKVDGGDTVVSRSAPLMYNVYVSLNGTEANGRYTLVKTSMIVADNTKAAWQNAYLLAGRQEGKKYVFEVVENSPETLFDVIVSDADQLGSNAIVWSGAGENSDFSDPLNWSGASLPGATSIASFTGNGTSQNIVFSSLTEVGAIELNSAKSINLSGEGGISFSETGSSYISALSGAHEISTKINLTSQLLFDVADNSILDVTGNIIGGSFRKIGGGKLIMSGEGNSFMDALVMDEGILSVTSPKSLAANKDSISDELRLNGGTLEFEGNDSEANLGRTLAYDVGAGKGAVINAKTDLTINSVKPISGALIKRGAGKLTYDIPGGSSFICNKSNGAGADPHMDQTTTELFELFPTTGGAPDVAKSFVDLNVAEGPFCIKPNGMIKTSAWDSRLNVGLSTPDGAIDPSLEINGGWLRIGSVHLGYVTKETFARNFGLDVHNGAFALLANFRVGAPKDIDTSVNVSVRDGSTVCCSSFAMQHRDRGFFSLNVEDGSTFASPGIGINMPFNICFNDSEVAKFKTWDYQEVEKNSVSLTFGYYSSGMIGFTNSVFRFKGVNRSSKENYKTNFGDGEIFIDFNNAIWDTGAENAEIYMRKAETVTFNVADGGLTIANASGKTFTTTMPFTGVGVLTKSGDGDLVFGEALSLVGTSPQWGDSTSITTNVCDRSYTLDVTGGLNILGGTVYVTATTIRPGLDVYIAKGAVLDLGGTTVEFNSIAGAGAVRNGAVKVGKLKINVDEGALIFDNAILESGRKIVDFGRTSENPLVEQKEVYDVCTFTSSLPSLTGWKVQNTGLEEAKGVFFAESDTVKVRLMPAGGLRIILR